MLRSFSEFYFILFLVLRMVEESWGGSKWDAGVIRRLVLFYFVFSVWWRSVYFVYFLPSSCGGDELVEVKVRSCGYSVSRRHPETLVWCALYLFFIPYFVWWRRVVGESPDCGLTCLS